MSLQVDPSSRAVEMDESQPISVDVVESSGEDEREATGWVSTRRRRARSSSSSDSEREVGVAFSEEDPRNARIRFSPTGGRRNGCSSFWCHFRALFCVHLQQEKNGGCLPMTCYVGCPLLLFLFPSIFALVYFLLLKFYLRKPSTFDPSDSYYVRPLRTVVPFLPHPPDDWDVYLPHHAHLDCTSWNFGEESEEGPTVVHGEVNEMNMVLEGCPSVGVVMTDEQRQNQDLGWLGRNRKRYGVLGNASPRGQFPCALLDDCTTHYHSDGNSTIVCPLCSWTPAFSRVDQKGKRAVTWEQLMESGSLGVIDLSRAQFEKTSVSARLHERIDDSGYSQAPAMVHMLMGSMANSISLEPQASKRESESVFVAELGFELPLFRGAYEAELPIKPDVAFLFALPLALSFLFPRVVGRVVSERRRGLTRYLRLFGVSASESEFARAAYDLASYLVFVVPAIAVPAVFQAEFFIKGNPGEYILLFLVWGIALVAGGYAFSLLHANEAIASANAYLLLFTSVFIGSCVSMVADAHSLPSFFYMAYPPFAFVRAFVCIVASYNPGSIQPSPSHFWICIAYLLGSAAVFSVIYGVVQSGVAEWILLRLRRFCCSCSCTKSKNEEDETFLSDIVLSTDVVSAGDSDCETEKASVLEFSVDDAEDKPVLVRGLTKAFGSRKVVNQVYFKIPESQCFGLLGPNGAGKTTLLRMLTGELAPSRGSASIFGLDCTLERGEVLKNISIVPQFDCLFDSLTVFETLLFFTRLRSVAKEKDAVEDIMDRVNLGDFRTQLVKNLSGGSKRRLSLGVALCGDPRILFLDEPSTGLDPASRRGLWDVIDRIKNSTRKMTVLLTTHSMLEAERLCDRIAIMSQGELRCIGDLLRLKEKFGKGFAVSLTCSSPDFRPRADEYIRSLLPLGVSDSDISVETMIYRIPSSEIRFSALFGLLDDAELRKRGIKSWSVNQASLEEVFMRIVKNDEERAEEVSKGFLHYLLCRCCPRSR